VIAFELGRSDIGFGRLIVDDGGITRARLFRTRRIAWADVRSYRLGAAPANATGDLGRAFGGWYAAAVDFMAAARGDARRMRYSFELIGERSRLLVNWRFEYVELAIEEALRRIGPRLLADARRELETTRVARFGPLAINADGVAWKSKPPLARAAVEAIEIAERLPLRFRVVQRDRALAYASAKLPDVPSVLHALELAEQLGYRVRGRELLGLF
jgi:hypothetical protein